MNILSPSMLSADFTRLREEILAVEQAGAKYLHVDVMDGKFVPSISFGMPVIASIRKASQIIFDVHLMIEEPIRYIEEFVKAGADIITVHLEACSDVKETLDKIHACGIKAGLTIKPNTPAESLRPYLDQVEMILLMSVEPGFGGQKYIESSTEKIRQVRAMIEESGRDIDLEVDGGINLENVDTVLQAGANVIVAGSAVFGEETGKKAALFMEKLA
ncbi:MAG: ribulose-phosphate 3-epimerase [Lachnospiraceae bacterium]|nr:ribulose-phosphate 3-epimerase [Lachnospiraceae bacterium]